MDITGFKKNFTPENLMSVGTGALNGITMLKNNYDTASRLNDTPVFYNNVAQMNNAGAYNYNNWGQFMNDYAQTPFGLVQKPEDVWEMNDAEKTGMKLSSTLGGASTGASIGSLFGPVGTAIGSVIGGGIGWLTGNNGIKRGEQLRDERVEADNARAFLAENAAQSNFDASGFQLGDRMHRDKAVNFNKNGGPMRRQMDVNEFANMVLGKKKRSAVTRTKVDGGVKIKINK